jgi:hypothetical protein
MAPLGWDVLILLGVCIPVAGYNHTARTGNPKIPEKHASK